MGKRLIFDYGHGGKDSGAVFGNRKEKDDVIKLGKDVKRKLESYSIVVDETRKADEYVTLQKRCNIANAKNYDYFISFHRNAFNGEAQGVETYIYTSKNSQANKLAGLINDSIASIGFKNRGVKTANFKVLRDTKAKAILIEVGFIDNINDNQIFDKKYNELVNVIVKAILKGLGISYKKDVYYRVVTGSFKNKDNAEKRVNELKKSGFDSFIEVSRR